MHDPDLPICPRCDGDGYVRAFLYDDGYEPVFGEVDCGTCGGSGNAPDPDQVAEYRATSAEYRAEMRQPVNPRR